MSRRSHHLLHASRMVGYLFAIILVLVLVLSAIPKYYFLVSSRAIINAPVQSITSRIAGRVTNLDLQIGDDVAPGQRAAQIENFEADASLMVSLRLERLQLSDRLKMIRSTQERTARQLTFIRAQIAATRQGVIDELAAMVSKSESRVRIYEARVGEQQSLVDQKRGLVEAELLNASVVKPLEQKLAAAQHELTAATGELERAKELSQSIIRGDYSGGFATNLMALEFQEQSLDLENKKASTQHTNVIDRIDKLDSLMSGEQGRYENAARAQVTALHKGRIVSVEVGHGDYLQQGGLLARSLDCSRSFVAAVFAGRDVAGLEIGTPAVVNIRSLGTKQRGRISKTVRYFSDGTENRYYKAFPAAKGHEIYVIIELDWSQEARQKEDLFFGCHVGEEVTVSLGEPLFDRVVRLLGSDSPAALDDRPDDVRPRQTALIQPATAELRIGLDEPRQTEARD